MPNYNCEKYIGEAIESILNQSYKNFEFIIIDDCSTDNSWDIIKKYSKKYKRLKIFRNEKNLKITKTRNKLFDLMNKKSKYFAIMDSDDISHKDRLKIQVDFLEREENKEVGVVGSNIFFIDENSKQIGFRKYKEKITKKDILIKSPVAQPSCMGRCEILKKVGRYDEKYKVAEDYDLWFRVFEKFKIENLEKNLLKYRISKNQSKNRELKTTIINSIFIKLKYMKFKDFFSIKVIFRIILGSILLVFPNSLILKTFYFMVVKK